MFFGGLISTSGLYPDSWVPTLVCGGAAFFGIPLVAYFGKKLNYRRTQYNFYEDRVELDEGFLTINKKTIKFRDVREVTLKRGILQRLHGLGTIYLATHATGWASGGSPFTIFGLSNASASGINVRDVANPEDTYQKIRALTDARH